MKLLVTGGCGFIGSNFIIQTLISDPDQKIINLDNLTYAGNRANLAPIENNPNYRFVKGDICDRELVNKLMKDVDIVVHFAAESHVDRSILYREQFIKTNIVGTHTLLDAALNQGKKRFHHISTDEVFGTLGKTGKFSEKTPYDPHSPYSASKAAADHLVRSYHDTYGLPVTISNCSNNYGPYQFPEKLIPLFITNLIDGKKVPVYGEGKNIRDWIHVEDHVRAIDLILKKGKIGETYCVGGETEMENIKVTNIILTEFGKGEEMIEFVPDRKGHDFRYAIDASKIKKELGWKQKHAFNKGIKETIIWYKDNEKWWRPLRKKVIEDITIK